MAVNFLALATPVIKQVAPIITEKIKNKISPSEIQQAILAGMKAAEVEDTQLPDEQHIFFKSKLDSVQGVPGFLDKFLNVAAVQEELAKSCDNQGQPNVDYLVAEFNNVAAKYSQVNPIESRVKPWLTTFVRVYFQTSSTYSKFQAAKANYFQQLNKRYDNIKFAGISVSGQEEVKALQQIFVMPDVVKSDRYARLSPEAFISEELPQQQRLILEQRQFARLTSSSSSPLLANKLLTETRTKKAVILGAPGSGKSTLVSYFAVMLAQGKAGDLGLDSNIDWLPIVIEIRDFEQNLERKIFDYLRRFAESNLTTKQLPPDFFQHWLDRGSAVILLDGIDEVADTGKRYRVVEKINSFLHQYQQNIAIVTSRPSGYKQDFFSTSDFPHYQLQPFDGNKIETFINHWYNSRYSDPQKANRWKENLKQAFENKDRIKLLAENPLLLTIIALIHRNQADLPNQRYELYDCAVKTLLTSWDDNKWDKEQKLSIRAIFEYIKPNDLRRLMERLAYWIHTQGNPEDARGGTIVGKKNLIKQLTLDIQNKKGIEFYQAEEEAKNFIEFIRNRTGLLNEQGTNRYAFVHKTFQEYLCSQEIYYQARSTFEFEPIKNAIQMHLHDSHWREVLLLLVSQLEGEIAVKAIRAKLENQSDYQQCLHRDLFFAASCLAENPQDIKFVDDGLADQILKDLVNLEIENYEKIGSKIRQQVFKVITSLVETEWETDDLQLLKAKKDKIGQWHFIYYQAELGEKSQAIAGLLPLLKDEDSAVRSRAALALGNIGKDNPKAIAALLALLKDKDSDVRVIAAEVLGQIDKDNPQTIAALLPLLKDEDYFVRRSAAFALGKIGKDNPQAIAALLPLLEDENSWVRSRAAYALGEIGKDNPEAIAALLSLLEDENSRVRWSAAYTLEEIGKNNPQAIAALLTLLEDENSRVRWSAAYALGEIGKNNPQAIAALLPLLEDEDSWVRSRAAEALGKIDKDNPEAIAALLARLKDEDSWVRSRAAEALGKIGKDNPQAIAALLPLLEDKKSDVRLNAAEALGKIGKDNPEAISLMVNWINKHQDTEYVSNGIDVLWNLVTDYD